MFIKNSERNAGKQQMIMTILNSMTQSERKEILNNIYGMYVDTDTVAVYEDIITIKNNINDLYSRFDFIKNSLDKYKKDTDYNIIEMKKDIYVLANLFFDYFNYMCDKDENNRKLYISLLNDMYNHFSDISKE